jgi:ABC-type polysaccharide/polyol phosphate transport system ATPase subunit
MPIVEVDHVTKEFQLGQFQSFRRSAIDLLARLRSGSRPRRQCLRALDDVAFKVEQGEVLGIIGQNGAGKSTLLKLLAGISSPTTGRVAVHGKVAPLIEVSAGLVPDLTGRENVFLNGSILGLKRKEIAAKFDEIVEFAELHDFIDTPVKRYSSGMRVRLGFSIATSVEADVLIVDEVLAVGDLAFQRKCFDRMENLMKRGGRTVLLVSHNIRQVERICNRVILLENGRIAEDGSPARVCDEFYRRSEKRYSVTTGRTSKNARRQSSGEVELVEVAVLGPDRKPVTEVGIGSAVDIRVTYSVNETLRRPVFGIGIHTLDFLYLATAHSDAELHCDELEPGQYDVWLHIPTFPFLPGIYCVRVGVAQGSFFSTTLYAENVASFQVVANSSKWTDALREGIVPLEGSWRVEPGSAGTTGSASPDARRTEEAPQEALP